MNKDALRLIIRALVEQTEDGLFPLVGYALEPNRLTLLTTSIPDLPLAIRILRTVTGAEYNLGHYLKADAAKRAAEENPHFLKIRSHDIPGLVLDSSLFDTLSSLVVVFGAPFFPKKAVGVVDICDFTKGSPFAQLADLYSLENIFRTNVKRCMPFTRALRITNNFGYASTGDGFFFWHDMLAGGADTATLVLLLCIMSQVERFRRERHFGMRLKAAFVIDSLFMVYDADDISCVPDPAASDDYTVERGPARNVVGVATNIAARLCSKARPSQILVSQFDRSGQGDETMSPHSIIAHAAQLFRHESNGSPSDLKFDPDCRMSVTDKHGMRWHCWNLTGKVPNTFKKRPAMQQIGLRSDDAIDLDAHTFNSEPWGRHELL